jgi:signal transduction histidine kinase
MGGDSRGQSLLDVASVRGTRIENDVRQALQGKEVVQTEVRFKSIFGANTELDYHAFPIRFGGRQVGAIGLIWDSKLTRLNAKEKLTDIVLAQTHSLVRLVRELREALPSPGVASDSRQESADLTTARKLADNLASAVEGLRSASRVAYGLRRTPIDVRNGLRSVLEQLNTGVSIDVRINAPPSLPRAACDPLLFHLIFENLARNALDAMRNVEHPVLRFDLRYPAPTLGEDGLEIMLLDNGPGLPEPVLCALRQGLGSADLARHAGLGLAIVRTLLEIAGGSIAVCDEPQKCGAGLGIELPVARNGRDR